MEKKEDDEKLKLRFLLGDSSILTSVPIRVLEKLHIPFFDTYLRVYDKQRVWNFSNAVDIDFHNHLTVSTGNRTLNITGNDIKSAMMTYLSFLKATLDLERRATDHGTTIAALFEELYMFEEYIATKQEKVNSRAEKLYGKYWESVILLREEELSFLIDMKHDQSFSRCFNIQEFCDKHYNDDHPHQAVYFDSLHSDDDTDDSLLYISEQRSDSRQGIDVEYVYVANLYFAKKLLQHCRDQISQYFKDIKLGGLSLSIASYFLDERICQFDHCYYDLESCLTYMSTFTVGIQNAIYSFFARLVSSHSPKFADRWRKFVSHASISEKMFKTSDRDSLVVFLRVPNKRLAKFKKATSIQEFDTYLKSVDNSYFIEDTCPDLSSLKRKLEYVEKVLECRNHTSRRARRSAYILEFSEDPELQSRVNDMPTSDVTLFVERLRNEYNKRYNEFLRTGK